MVEVYDRFILKSVEKFEYFDSSCFHTIKTQFDYFNDTCLQLAEKHQFPIRKACTIVVYPIEIKYYLRREGSNIYSQQRKIYYWKTKCIIFH
jgi:hypothetical protein